MKKGLTGYVPVRNGLRLDYAFELAIKSLLPVCDEVIACDSDSDDGTKELLYTWAAKEPKLRVINYPWPVLPSAEDVAAGRPGPPGDPMMLAKWLNFTREHAEYSMQITLDADEVLHPEAYPEVLRTVEAFESRWFKRMNFWGDPWHLVPDGHVCGMNVARMGPTCLWMPSDNPHPDGEPMIRRFAKYEDSLRIWHLGFLRRPEAFFAKSKVMQAAVCNSYDPRLLEAEQTGRPWHEVSTFNAEVLPYTGTHPEIVHDWLRERGYNPHKNA